MNITWKEVSGENRCLHCAGCVISCPEGALSFTDGKYGGKLVWNKDKCKGCGLCAKVCPEGVLEVDYHDNGGETPKNRRGDKMKIKTSEIIFEKVKTNPGFVRNIKKVGIQKNINLELLPKPVRGKKYRVTDGRRTLNALVELGITEIDERDVKIANPKNDIDRALLTLSTNIHRSDNPGVEAENIKILMELGGMTQEEVAKFLDVDQSQISKRMRLLKLRPKLFDRVKKGEMKPSIAREIAGMPQEEQKKYENKERIDLKDVMESRRKANLEEIDLARAEDIGGESPSGEKETVVGYLKNILNTPLSSQEKAHILATIDIISGTVTKPKKEKTETKPEPKLRIKPGFRTQRCPICHRQYPPSHMKEKHSWVWDKKQQKYVEPKR